LKIRKHLLPAAVVALLSFCLFGLVIFFYLNRAQKVWEKDERARLMRVLNNKRSSLESELYARIYYTKSVAAYVSLRPEVRTDEFYNLAHELIQEDPIIKTMSLARNGVINAVFPPRGNEAVIGLDLFAHEEREAIVRQTVQTGKTFVAGPVDLVEGGIAFISYTPIFNKTQPDPAPFWGMTDIVILKSELIAAAGIEERENNSRFAIRGYDGKGNEGAVFFGDPAIFDRQPVTVSAALPDGEWIIGAIPENGWSGYWDQDRMFFLLLVGSSLIISILLGLFASAVYRIRNDAQQMSSIFRGMTGWILEVDKDLRIVWRAPTRSREPQPLLQLEEGDGLAEKLPSLTSTHLETLSSCLATQTIETFELEIPTSDGARWMLVTVSPKGDDRLVLVIQNITLQKEQQAQLRASEEELRRLNANKDRLFSIIAHDLRTPFSAITGLSDQLLQRRDSMPAEEQREFVELIYQSGRENLHLLENLLNWARSQQDGLVAQRVEIELRTIAEASLNVFRELASQKGIQLVNTIPEGKPVSFDRQMLEAVFRNLVSNAIKFSHSGQQVEIGLSPIEATIAGEAVVEVYVKDEGIGMDAATKEMLMEEHSSALSSPGTHAEHGAGLGLSLCRDFLALHGQTLRIESAPGAGTTIFFTVPRAPQKP
jgi:signal transduction histidine kinase